MSRLFAPALLSAAVLVLGVGISPALAQTSGEGERQTQGQLRASEVIIQQQRSATAPRRAQSQPAVNNSQPARNQRGKKASPLSPPTRSTPAQPVKQLSRYPKVYNFDRCPAVVAGGRPQARSVFDLTNDFRARQQQYDNCRRYLDDQRASAPSSGVKAKAKAKNKRPAPTRVRDVLGQSGYSSTGQSTLSTEHMSFSPDATSLLAHLPLRAEPTQSTQDLSVDLGTEVAQVHLWATSFRWDWADGPTQVTSAPTEVSHTYDRPGAYRVTLTITWEGEYTLADGKVHPLQGSATTTDTSPDFAVHLLTPHFKALTPTTLPSASLPSAPPANLPANPGTAATTPSATPAPSATPTPSAAPYRS